MASEAKRWAMYVTDWVASGWVTKSKPVRKAIIGLCLLIDASFITGVEKVIQVSHQTKKALIR